MQAKDITGKIFGRLTVLYKLNNYSKKRVWWLCVCDCGKLVEICGTTLRNGHTKSCGCLNHVPSNIKHGKHNTRIYHIYNSIKQRCYNKNTSQYNDWGGRGIDMCDEWKDDFQAFYDWAMSHGYDDLLTIDRIDVNGNYEPNNCRWVDMKIQNRNRRSNNNYTINGETRCLKEWCEILNLNYQTVQSRIHILHWNIEKALELEVGNNGNYK